MKAADERRVSSWRPRPALRVGNVVCSRCCGLSVVPRMCSTVEMVLWSQLVVRAVVR